MVVGKLQKPVIPLSPQEIARRFAGEGLKGAVEKAISHSEEDYRKSYKKLLESRSHRPEINRFGRTEADVQTFLENIYEHLPSLFRRMVDDAVEEQGRINTLTKDQQDDLRRELANVIDQELRFRGRVV